MSVDFTSERDRKTKKRLNKEDGEYKNKVELDRWYEKVPFMSADKKMHFKIQLVKKYKTHKSREYVGSTKHSPNIMAELKAKNAVFKDSEANH